MPIPLNFRVKFGAEPPVDIELHAGDVGIFWGASFSEVQAFLDKEICLSLASFSP